MATTRERLAEIGGFESMVNHHSDDFTLGNEIAKNGYRIELTRKAVWMVFPNESLLDFFKHELRWSIMLKEHPPWRLSQHVHDLRLCLDTAHSLNCPFLGGFCGLCAPLSCPEVVCGMVGWRSHY